ncbi:MAG TPA: hypothetical protein VD978_18230 [Azospirillum sp.]|nr:hypothetical protein [Azospirillum sp.]
MSISDVPSSSVSQLYQYQNRRPPGPGKEIREGIDTLKKALESNDLEAAQKAYDSLSEAAGKRQGGGSSTSGTSGTGKDPLSTMLSEVGTALKTGDISQVQQAFAEFGPPQGGASGRGGPPPGPPPGGQGPSDEVKDAMGQLAQSLSSGDLSSAQSAFETLSALFEEESDDSAGTSSSSGTSSTTSATSASSTASTSAADRFKELLGDLGSALQTGHLASAQSLFAAMAPRGSQGIDIMA